MNGYEGACEPCMGRRDIVWSVANPFAHDDVTHGHKFRFQEDFSSSSYNQMFRRASRNENDSSCYNLVSFPFV